MRDWDDRDRASVIEDLASPDEEVRRLAVERIDALGQEEALPHLVARLGDDDWRVRKAAVRRVAARRDHEEVVGPLIEALADGENPGRRNAAVEAIVEIGEDAVGQLVASCADADADVRKFVVDALAGIGNERAVDALVKRLADPDANVRAAATDALGAIGGENARAALRATAIRSEEDPLVRFSALHALDALEEPLRAAELAAVLDDPMLGPAGLGLLGRCDDPGALDALLKGLASGVRAARESAIRSVLRLCAGLEPGELASVRERFVALAVSEPGLAPAVIARLPDCDLGTQLALVQFLGLIGSREAVIPMLEAGRDEALAQVALGALEQIGGEVASEIEAAWATLDVESRAVACDALGRIGGDRALGRLLVALEDPDPTLRASAARSLASLGAEQALAPLVQRLQQAAPEQSLDGEEEPEAIVEAIVALAGPDAEGRSPDLVATAVPLLSAALTNANDEIRLLVARVLSAIARRTDAELVAMLLKDPCPDVRGAAVDAIARLETDRMPEPLHLAIADEAPGVRIAAARALGALGHATVFEDLRRLADDEDARVRAVAVAAIGRRFTRAEDPETRARALGELNRACEDEAPVALAIAEAAYETGGDAVAYVSSLLTRTEPEVVIGAARCLGAHADAADLDVLIPLVAHADWSVRAEVVEILGDRRVQRSIPAILRRLETEQDDFVRTVTLSALQKLEG